MQMAKAAPGPDTKVDHRWLAESLWRRVAELKRYPASARLNGQEGKVILKAVIRSDGHLAEVTVQKSSGHHILDTAAIEAVRLACPLHMKHAIGKPGNRSESPDCLQSGELTAKRRSDVTTRSANRQRRLGSCLSPIVLTLGLVTSGHPCRRGVGRRNRRRVSESNMSPFIRQRRWSVPLSRSMMKESSPPPGWRKTKKRARFCLQGRKRQAARSERSVPVNQPHESPYYRQESPALVVRGRDVFVTWSMTHPKMTPDKPFSGELRLSRSSDGGRSFGPSTLVNDDEQVIQHTFDAMQVAPDGVVHLAWIDGREGKKDPGTFVARSTDQGRTITRNFKVDDNTCVCCRTSLAISADGIVYVAWRKIFDGNIRETVVARSTDGGLTLFVSGGRRTTTNGNIKPAPSSGVAGCGPARTALCRLVHGRRR